MKTSPPYLSFFANLILLIVAIYLIISIFKKEPFDVFWISNAVCTVVAVSVFKQIIRNTQPIFTLENIQKIKLIGVCYLVLGCVFVLINILNSSQITLFYDKFNSLTFFSFFGFFLGTIFGMLTCLLETPALIAGFIFLGIAEIMKEGWQLQQEQDLTI